MRLGIADGRNAWGVDYEPAFRTLLLRRSVVDFAITLGKMRCGDETAGDRNFNDGHRGLNQKMSRAVQSDLQIIAGR